MTPFLCLERGKATSGSDKSSGRSQPGRCLGPLPTAVMGERLGNGFCRAMRTTSRTCRGSLAVMHSPRSLSE